MKRFLNKKGLIAVLILIILVVTGVFYFNRRHYGLTPESACKLYLQEVTSKHYEVIEVKPARIDGDSAICGIVSNDKYNWLNSNNGRADGENIHLFTLKKNSKGWYVVDDKDDSK